MAFDKSRLIDLDECVLNALELFIRTLLPHPDLGEFTKPLVLGSGNAAATGRVMFADREAVFADEGSYKAKLSSVSGINGAVLISASGGKHAPVIAEDLRARGIKTILLTNNPDAPAGKFVSKTYVFPKNPEPYTYNTSTYLGLILSKTGERPGKILDHIQKIRAAVPENLSSYSAYYLLVPETYDVVREMFQTKFDELFGPMVTARVFTPEQTKHAKTVVSSDRELFISFGCQNDLFGTQRLFIPLPENVGFGAVLAVGYYIIGHIQKQHPPYFKDSIQAYTKMASKVFNQTITPITE